METTSTEDHIGQRAHGVAQQSLRSLWALQSQKSQEPLQWGCEGTLKAPLAHLLNKLNQKEMEQRRGDGSDHGFSGRT